MQKNSFLRFLKQSYIYILIFLIYVPLIVVVLLSFTSPSLKGNINNSFDWNDGSNYVELFKDNTFLNSLLNTFIIVIITVPISTIIGIITCFGIWNSKQFYVNTTTTFSKINMAIPDVITGISLSLMFSVTWILIFKQDLGFATIILSHISFCTPYAIIIIYPRMQKMKKNLILASQDLGYSKIKTFFKVTIPFLTPSIVSAALIVFSMSFDDFIITKLVGGSVSTISTELYTMAKGIKAWAVTFGAILVLITFLIVLILIIKKTVTLKKSNNLNENRKWKIKRNLKKLSSAPLV